jgi:quercetin dioxygenase-like cupin family protein
LRRLLTELGYTCHRYAYPPGTVFPEHAHDVDKIDAVLSGRFRITMDGKSAILQAGDYVFVPNGTVHRVEVVGDEPVVSIDAVKKQD